MNFMAEEYAQGMGTSPNQNVQPPPAPVQNAPGKNKLPYVLGGAVVLIIIIAGGYYFLSSKPSAANTSITSTLSVSTTIAPNGTVQNVTNGGGQGQSFISGSEASGLVGPDCGTNYSALYSTNVSSLSGIYTNNVTGYWAVNCTAHPNSTTTESLSEYVYQSTKSDYLYAIELNTLVITNNITTKVINATANGLKYSYIKYSKPGNVTGSQLVGYKNNEFVSVVSPYGLNQVTLALIAAQDIP